MPFGFFYLWLHRPVVWTKGEAEYHGAEGKAEQTFSTHDNQKTGREGRRAILRRHTPVTSLLQLGSNFSFYHLPIML